MPNLLLLLQMVLDWWFQEIATMPLFHKFILIIYDDLVMTTCYYDYHVKTTLQSCLVFQEVIVTNLLCYCSASVTPAILPEKSPIWKAPSIKLWISCFSQVHCWSLKLICPSSLGQWSFWFFEMNTNGILIVILPQFWNIKQIWRY